MHDGRVTDVSRDVEWARLGIVRVADTLKKRKVWQVACLNPGREFGVHDNCLTNLLRGIRERVFAVESDGGLVTPPRPDPGIFDSTLSSFERLLRKRCAVTTPWTDEEFLSTYEGRRRTIYEAAIASLATKPVNRRDAYSSAFLKAEKIPFYQKPDPAPRLIHPRSPRYNAAVGVYIKKIEHRVYTAVNEVWNGVSPTILKGYNAAQVGAHMAAKWNRFKRPVAIGLDASRFDQHVSASALQWEHRQYLNFYRGNDRRELARLLSWQLKTKVWARCRDGVVRYTVDGMRFSGDMNTGLGNCLLMCAMVWEWARKVGVQCELANNGDDCVVIMEAHDLQRWNDNLMKTWFRGLGFTMKSETPVRVLEQVEFCQSQPVCIDGKWLMVRKHGHAMSKDCVCIKPLDSPGVFDKWRNTVGLAGLSLTGGVPVQQSFYMAMRRGAGSATMTDTTLETGFMRFARGMQRTVGPISPDSRYSYWLAFGVTPDEQEALEAEMDSVTPVWSKPSTEGCFTTKTSWYQ